MAKKKVKPTVVQAKGNYNLAAKKFDKKLKKTQQHPFNAKAIGGMSTSRHEMLNQIR